MNLTDVKQIAASHIDVRGWVEIIIVCVMAAVIWVKSVAHDAPVNQWTKAPPSPELSMVGKEKLSIKKPIIIYVDRVKEVLVLPPEIKNDPNEHVLEATQLVATDHPQEVVCTQNSETGVAALSVRIQPMPWLAAENRGEVRLDYGIKNGAQAARLSGHWDVMAIKDWNLGASGEVYNDMTSFVGVGASVRLW